MRLCTQVFPGYFTFAQQVKTAAGLSNRNHRDRRSVMVTRKRRSRPASTCRASRTATISVQRSTLFIWPRTAAPAQILLHPPNATDRSLCDRVDRRTQSPPLQTTPRGWRDFSPLSADPIRTSTPLVTIAAPTRNRLSHQTAPRRPLLTLSNARREADGGLNDFMLNDGIRAGTASAIIASTLHGVRGVKNSKSVRAKLVASPRPDERTALPEIVP